MNLEFHAFVDGFSCLKAAIKSVGWQAAQKSSGFIPKFSQKNYRS